MKIDNFTYFYPEKPSLISIEQPLFETLSNSENYVAERKYNGTRLQLHFNKGKFEFWNRHGAKLSYRPNDEIMDELHSLNLKGYCLFDGELRHNKVKELQHKIMLYDVFVMEDEFQLKVPFSKRREILSGMLKEDVDPLGIPFQFKGDFNSVFQDVIQDEEIEGLVMKNVNGKLNLGRKTAVPSTWMYKVRRPSKNYRF